MENKSNDSRHIKKTLAPASQAQLDAGLNPKLRGLNGNGVAKSPSQGQSTGMASFAEGQGPSIPAGSLTAESTSQTDPLHSTPHE